MSDKTQLETHLQKDIDTIKSKIQEMASLAENALNRSFFAFLNKNGQLAYSVILLDQKIDKLELAAQENEIYEFLLYTPPPAFQNVFISSGMFVDDENNFVLEDYQEAVKGGDLPEELNSVFARLAAIV